MDEKWICSNCGAENALKFCTKCGTPKPEEVIPEIKAEDNSWNCSCGQTGNIGNFCRSCGLPKEQGIVLQKAGTETVQEEMNAEADTAISEVEIIEEIPAEEAVPEVKEIADGSWNCICGQSGNKGNFCRNCGTPREQGFAPADTPLAAAKAAFTGELPAMEGPEVPEPSAQEPKKKKTFKPLIILIAGIVVIAAIVAALVLLLGQKKYTVNRQPQAEVLEVKEGFSLFTDKERDISFLYPDDLLADRGEDGDYIYGGQKAEYPYVRINRVNDKTKPKDYFKKYQESLKQEYGDLELSQIYEVEVEGKMLYMMQTYLPSEGVDQDQYLELYDDCYITYSAKGYGSADENRELYYAIASLRTSSDAYPIPEAQIYENDTGNYSVEVLPDYEVKEFAGGLYAEKGNAGLFVTYLNTDSLGAIIYDRADFLDRLDRISDYLEGILGVQSVEIVNEEKSETINGKDYLVSEAEFVLKNGSEAEGKICIGDSDHTIGCYLICYYLEKDAGSLQKEEAENFLQSISVNGDPNIREFVIKDLSSAGFGTIAVRGDLLGTVDIQSDKVVIHNPEDTQTITIETREGADLYDDIASKIAQELADKYESSHLEEIEPPEDGRYYMNACQITYTADKDVKRVFRIYCISSKSDQKYCIDYDVEEGKEDWVNEVCDYLFWSWKLY